MTTISKNASLSPVISGTVNVNTTRTVTVSLPSTSNNGTGGNFISPNHMHGGHVCGGGGGAGGNSTYTNHMYGGYVTTFGTNPSGAGELKPSIVIALISYDQVLPETRFLLMTLLKSFHNIMSSMITHKLCVPEFQKDITFIMFTAREKIKGFADTAITEMVEKKFMIVDRDSYFLTDSGLELINMFLQYDNI